MSTAFKDSIRQINSVLCGSKPHGGEACCVDPVQLLQSSIKLMHQLASKGGVELKLDAPDALPRITADPGAVMQILLNLLANAIKFSSPNTRVNVRSWREGRKIVFEVADNGIGMSPETVDRLGEKFFQAENNPKCGLAGTGLGLSIVFGLVELHGGDVEIESIKGRGTAVRIVLPIITDSAKPVPADPEREIVYLRPSANDAEFKPLNLAKKIG